MRFLIAIFSIGAISLAIAYVLAQGLERAAITPQVTGSVGRQGDPAVVAVRINDKSYKFIVDTGCSQTIYDICLLNVLGQHVDTRRFNAPHTTGFVRRYAAPQAYVGHLPLPRDQPVPVVDLAYVKSHIKGSLDGVLGMDFLKHHVLSIEFDSGTCTILDGSGRREGQSFQLHKDEVIDVPYIDADLSGLVERFEVDTGCVEDAIVSERLFKGLAHQGQLQDYRERGWSGLGESGVTYCASLSRLRLGLFEHRGLIVSSGRRSRLGMGYWSRYNVTFDFPSSRVYLRKGKEYDRPSRVSR
jgi:hypothetical protein